MPPATLTPPAPPRARAHEAHLPLSLSERLAVERIAVHLRLGFDDTLAVLEGRASAPPPPAPPPPLPPPRFTLPADEAPAIAASLGVPLAWLTAAFNAFLERAQVGDPDACWRWSGNTASAPSLSVRASAGTPPVACRANRLAWAFGHGAISPGLCVHRCHRRPDCCNPRHLHAGRARPRQEP